MKSWAPASRAAAITRSIAMAGSTSAMFSRTERLNSTFSDGSGGQFLYMPGGGSLHPTSKDTIAKKMHYVHQDGQQVFKFAVRRC